MNSLKRFSIFGTIFVIIFGTLSHFVYDWSQQNFFVGLFTPINEAVWEHMKLIFFPMLLFSFFMKFKLESDYPCIKSSLYLGIIIGTLLIPILFYTYVGFLGFHNLVLDILIFLISIIISFIFIYKTTVTCKYNKYEKFLSFVIFLFIIAFFIFSYYPPNLGIFIDSSLS